MANKKKNNNRKRGFTFPQAAWAGMTSPYIIKQAPFGQSIAQDILDGEFERALQQWYTKFTGMNLEGQFRIEQLIEGYKPIIAGLGAHYLASKSGLNRMIAQSGIPVLRI